MQKDNILRIVDKETGLFIRDDFTLDEEVEIGLYVAPAQGLYKPKWNFNTEEWIEGATGEEIKELTKPQPKEIRLEERLEQTEQLLQATTMAFTEFIFSQTMGK